LFQEEEEIFDFLKFFGKIEVNLFKFFNLFFVSDEFIFKENIFGGLFFVFKEEKGKERLLLLLLLMDVFNGGAKNK